MNDRAKNSQEWQAIAKELAFQGCSLKELIFESPNSMLFRGVQMQLEREVAIKVLAASHCQTSFERFEKESKLLASFEHENIVKLYSTGRLADGRIYMLLEYIHGITLEKFMDENKSITEAQIRIIGAQIAKALSYAHARKIVHRDIKPANVLVESKSTETGGSTGLKIKLIDFGIHKNLAPEAEKDEGLTREGQLPGTANYMSPEQCQGKELDGRSDIYSLACLLYELACGKPPMQAESDWLVRSKHLNDKITELKSREPLSKELRDLILCCLEKKPEERIQSANEIAGILEKEFKANKQTQLPLVSTIIACTCLALLLAAYLYSSFQKSAKNASSALLKKERPVNDTAVSDLAARGSWERFSVLPDKQKAGKRGLWLKLHLNSNSSWENLGLCVFECMSRNDTVDKKTLKALLEKVNRAIKSSNFNLKDTYELKEYYFILSARFYTELALQEYEQAEKSLDEIWKLPEQEQNRKQDIQAKVLFIYKTLQTNSMPEKADQVFARYAEQFNEGHDRAEIYFEQYRSLLSRGQANKYGKLALAEYQKLAGSEHLAQLEINHYFLAQGCALMNMKDESSEVCKLDRRLFKELDRSPSQLELATEVAKSFLETGKLNEAATLIKEIGASKALNEKTEYRCRLNMLTLLRSIYMKEKPDLVRKELESVLNHVAKSSSPTLYSHYEAGAVEQTCLAYYPDLLADCDRILSKKDDLSLGILHTTIGHFLRDQKKHEEAINEYATARKYFAVSDPHYHGLLNLNIGETHSYLACGKIQKAGSSLAEATALAKASKDPLKLKEVENLEARYNRALEF